MSKTETVTLEKIEAAIDAFSRERVRWLVGKGDILIQNGELSQERYNELVQKTVRDEIHRSLILQQFDELPKTVSSLTKSTDLESDLILWNLLAMLKWNQVEIVGEEKHEYLYARKEI